MLGVCRLYDKKNARLFLLSSVPNVFFRRCEEVKHQLIYPCGGVWAIMADMYVQFGVGIGPPRQNFQL